MVKSGTLIFYNAFRHKIKFYRENNDKAKFKSYYENVRCRKAKSIFYFIFILIIKGRVAVTVGIKCTFIVRI